MRTVRFYPCTSSFELSYLCFAICRLVQDFTDFPHQVNGAKGLLDEMIARFNHAMAEDGVVGIPGHIDDFDVGMKSR
jgi:hypothetical protein